MIPKTNGAASLRLLLQKAYLPRAIFLALFSLVTLLASPFSLHLLPVGSFASATLWASGSEELVLSLFHRARDPDLTAHEWGTFTSIAGPDGSAMDWLPIIGSTELPSFVEHFREAHFKGGLRGTVRMETPVLYFYSPHEANVSVNVSFPNGLITEWYPHADSVNLGLTTRDVSLYNLKSPGAISWNSIHIDPRGATDFPSDNSENHYFAARQTSSVPLELSMSSGTQREKFLFYRGVAAFRPPLTATLSSDGTVSLQNHLPAVRSKGSVPQLRHFIPASFRLQPLRHLSSETDASSNEIPKVILFERRSTKLGFRVLGPLSDQASLATPALDGSLDSLSSTLEGMLVSEGLFPDEAHAMLETWKTSWFEEGSRLIYILPHPFIDSVLPLHIQPTPVDTVRVFVGRLELITPATQRAVESAFAAGDRATLAKYKRFLDPILRSMIEQSTDTSREQRLLRYLNSLPIASR
jgi:hypothetical protein